MTQQPHFDAGEAAADITEGLSPGCYLAQVRGGATGALGVLYATRAQAPASDDDYFECRIGATFIFRAGSGVGPTWVKVDPGDPAYSAITRPLPVAIARTD